MKTIRQHWLLAFAVVLVAAAAVILSLQYLVFRDGKTLLFYLFMDIGFLPLEALIVGLVIERFIEVREKQEVAHKLNMVMGAFFSELGTPLISELLPGITSVSQIREQLHLKASWKKEDFSRASRFARAFKSDVDLGQIDLVELRSHLVSRRQFMLRLLENPNLMEHDRFTDLLWAVLHVQEELEARDSLQELHPPDEAHLEGDVLRAFDHLLAEWILYASHLKEDYPYLFSLVVRMHPFQDTRSAEVTS
jgi:hypothetical protein